MSGGHPFHDVAIAGVYNTRQARVLDGHDSQSIAVEGALGALADAGMSLDDVDGIAGQFAADLVLGARMGPCSRKLSGHGIPTVLEAASMASFSLLRRWFHCTRSVCLPARCLTSA